MLVFMLTNVLCTQTVTTLRQVEMNHGASSAAIFYDLYQVAWHRLDNHPHETPSGNDLPVFSVTALNSFDVSFGGSSKLTMFYRGFIWFIRCVVISDETLLTFQFVMEQYE
ncbi:hypothetical protein ElyMa_006967900 [Elysia marginata]|uniref:Polycystin domain-containing protein n=1 Tax=Elysia marginata TaxID=1093978 RepID=A0AAV4JMD9_9GAST|nr:hypothetical protein ElyMa_006967900 [Elysia marginata]